MCRAQGTISSGEIQLKLVHLVSYDIIINQHLPGNLCTLSLLITNQIWRHGDRNPEKTYPTDPYKDPSFWVNCTSSIFNHETIYD